MQCFAISGWLGTNTTYTFMESSEYIKHASVLTYICRQYHEPDLPHTWILRLSETFHHFIHFTPSQETTPSPEGATYLIGKHPGNIQETTKPQQKVTISLNMCQVTHTHTLADVDLSHHRGGTHIQPIRILTGGVNTQHGKSTSFRCELLPQSSNSKVKKSLHSYNVHITSTNI